jgi:hypothetical protein
MSGTRRAAAWFVVAVLAVLFVTPRADASGFGRAGVVIVHGDGTVKVDCVALDRPSMTGFRLLRMSRFKFRSDDTSFGHGVCWIDHEGVKTTDPSQCYTDPNGNFWDYWNQDRGETSPTESSTGPDGRTVTKGSIDYWKWNPNTYPDPEPAPDALTFKQICGR